MNHPGVFLGEDRRHSDVEAGRMIDTSEMYDSLSRYISTNYSSASTSASASASVIHPGLRALGEHREPISMDCEEAWKIVLVIEANCGHEPGKSPHTTL
jgi:hypothetical protein